MRSSGEIDLGFADDAGEDDRQQAGTRIAGTLREHALDFDAADGAMIEIARELLLLGPRAGQEAAAAGAANLQRREVGEDAEHAGDLRMQQAAIADGEVQGEVVRARPGAQDFGVGGEQQVRGRQAGCGGRALSLLQTAGVSSAWRRLKRGSARRAGSTASGRAGAAGSVSSRASQ